MKKINLAIFVFTSFFTFAQTPCDNGRAGIFPCKNIDLLSVLTPEEVFADELDGVRINDLWGWTDSTSGKEYVILGMVNGTSFIDVSDPVNPLFLGVLLEHNSIHLPKRSPLRKPQHLGAKSIWRDIKVYKNHAYIVSEDPLHGMQVFDLTLLRDTSGIPKNFEETAHYDGISNAHNIVINEETGYAYAVGATGNELSQPCTDGGLHMINLTEPESPVFAGCFDDDGYTHDAQVVIYTGPDDEYEGKEIAFNSNENTFTIVDVTDKNNPSQISRTGYELVEYMHQGWLTEDQRFFLSNDERDEERHNINTRTLIWDVTDLDNPRNTGFFFSDKESIDHNLYLKDRYAYQSNYTAGLRVLNASRVEDSTLSEAGYFDTYPLNDFVGFAGTWSNYPYFESGIIVVSDDNGLFILQPNLEVKIETQPKDFVTCDNGEEAIFSIFSREENVTYQWQENSTGYFKSIEDNESFSGASSDVLTVSNYDESFYQTTFRCLITSPDHRFSYSNEVGLIKDIETDVGFTFSEEDGMYRFVNTSSKQGEVQWDLGEGTVIINEDTVDFMFSESGDYRITLEVDSRCGITNYEEVVPILTGIHAEDYLNKIIVFPSPTRDKLSVQINDLPVGDIRIKLCDHKGRLLISKSIINYSKQSETELNLSSLTSGIYILYIASKGNELLRTKVVKY